MDERNERRDYQRTSQASAFPKRTRVNALQ
jgi:hypothetical protein